jgi:hypothetical protein
MTIQGPVPPQIPFHPSSQSAPLSAIALTYLAALLSQVAEKLKQ